MPRKKTHYEKKGLVRQIAGSIFSSNKDKSQEGKWRPRKKQFERLLPDNDEIVSVDLITRAFSVESESGDYRRDLLFQEKKTVFDHARNKKRDLGCITLKPSVRDKGKVRSSSKKPKKEKSEHSLNSSDPFGSDTFNFKPFGGSDESVDDTLSRHTSSSSKHTNSTQHSAFHTIKSDPSEFFSKQPARLTRNNLEQMAAMTAEIAQSFSNDSIENINPRSKFHQFTIDEDKESTVILPVGFPGDESYEEEEEEEEMLEEDSQQSLGFTSKGTQIQRRSPRLSRAKNSHGSSNNVKTPALADDPRKGEWASSNESRGLKQDFSIGGESVFPSNMNERGTFFPPPFDTKESVPQEDPSHRQLSSQSLVYSDNSHEDGHLGFANYRWPSAAHIPSAEKLTRSSSHNERTPLSPLNVQNVPKPSSGARTEKASKLNTFLTNDCNSKKQNTENGWPPFSERSTFNEAPPDNPTALFPSSATPTDFGGLANPGDFFPNFVDSHESAGSASRGKGSRTEDSTAPSVKPTGKMKTGNRWRERTLNPSNSERKRNQGKSRAVARHNPIPTEPTEKFQSAQQQDQLSAEPIIIPMDEIDPFDPWRNLAQNAGERNKTSFDSKEFIHHTPEQTRHRAYPNHPFVEKLDNFHANEAEALPASFHPKTFSPTQEQDPKKMDFNAIPPENTKHNLLAKSNFATTFDAIGEKNPFESCCSGERSINVKSSMDTKLKLQSVADPFASTQTDIVSTSNHLNSTAGASSFKPNGTLGRSNAMDTTDNANSNLNKTKSISHHFPQAETSFVSTGTSSNGDNPLKPGSVFGILKQVKASDDNNTVSRSIGEEPGVTLQQRSKIEAFERSILPWNTPTNSSVADANVGASFNHEFKPRVHSAWGEQTIPEKRSIGTDHENDLDEDVMTDFDAEKQIQSAEERPIGIQSFPSSALVSRNSSSSASSIFSADHHRRKSANNRSFHSHSARDSSLCSHGLPKSQCCHASEKYVSASDDESSNRRQSTSTTSYAKPLGLPNNAIMASMLFRRHHNIDTRAVEAKIKAKEREYTPDRSLGDIPRSVHAHEEAYSCVSSFSEDTAAQMDMWKKPTRDLLEHFSRSRKAQYDFRSRAAEQKRTHPTSLYEA